MKKEIFICWSIILSVAVIGSIIVFNNLAFINKNQEELNREAHETYLFNKLQNKTKIQQISISTTKAMYTIVITFIIGFIITIINTLYLFKTLNKRINFLLEGVTQVSSGNLEYVIPLISNDEFGVLTKSFNKMSKTLKEKEYDLMINNEELKKINKELKELSDSLEEKVHTRTEEIETIMQTMGDGLFTVNKNQEIVYFNRAAEKLLGYKKSEVEHKACVDILKCPNCTLSCAFLASASSGQDQCRAINETYILDKQGKKIPVIKDAIILKDKNNNNIGAVETIHDITNIKEMEQIKNDFLSMVTHDLKSPLTSILGFTSLCLRNKLILQDENMHGNLERIRTNSHKMLNLIENFLTASRLEVGKFELNIRKVNIVDLLNDVINDLKISAESKNITILANFEEHLPEVIADEVQLERIFHNVISNSIKYSTPEKKQNIYINVNKQDVFVDIAIKDEGIGIAKNELNEVFNKYKRSSIGTHNIKGSGLGLYIVKSLVEAHKGAIAIDSELGKGTIITISLPHIA
ncbi:PAS domain S-box protein [Candidatus Poribacteria bacterium]|nr:PAS domain S-box protein [Candidatus Poribacteria bacterium]